MADEVSIVVDVTEANVFIQVEEIENVTLVVDEGVGPRGFSAYEIAVQNGFIGTEQEWLDSLKGSGSAIQIVAAENLLKYDVVNIDGTKADSSILNKRDFAIGLASENINTGFSGSIDTEGEITNPLWTWTTGDVLYLNGNSISKIPPSSGFIQRLGVAKAATIIELQLTPSILI